MNKGFINEIGIWIASGLLALASFFSPNQPEPITLGANAKISELDALSTADSDDFFPIVDNSASATKKITVSNLFSSVSLGSASSTNFFGGNLTGNTLRVGQTATTTIASNGELYVVASTTLQRVTSTHSTSTNATSTNFYSTTASTTNLYGANINGFKLTTCTGSNFIQWSGGSFGCDTPSLGGVSIFSTTTTSNMATATIPVADMPTGNNLRLVITSPDIVGVSTTTADVLLAFDNDLTAIKYAWLTSAASISGTQGYIRLIDANSGEKSLKYAEMNISNITGIAKMGTYFGMSTATSTNSGPATIGTGYVSGRFTYNSAAKITQMDVWTSAAGSMFATGTVFSIFSN